MFWRQNSKLSIFQILARLIVPMVEFASVTICARVLMVSGSDEHGTPITVSAEQKGISPQEVVDEYHSINQKALLDLGCAWGQNRLLIFCYTTMPAPAVAKPTLFRNISNNSRPVPL